MTEKIQPKDIVLAARWYAKRGMQISLDCDRPDSLLIYPQTNRKWRREFYVEVSSAEIAYRAALQKNIEEKNEK